MQLSVSSGKYGILQRATFLTFGDSQDHTTDYPLADMVASGNRWHHNVAQRIWRASGTWEFDDKNQTDLPFATATLVADQRDYSLPTTAIALHGVAIKDSAGVWHKLRQIDRTEIPVPLDEYEKNSGTPHSYDVVGNSIFLFPAPSSSAVTLSSGLKVFLDREATTFTVPASYTTADTTEPGFDEAFHDIICYGIAADYCDVNGPDERAQKYFARITLAFQDIDEHYGRKNRDKKVKFKPHKEIYR